MWGWRERLVVAVHVFPFLDKFIWPLRATVWLCGARACHLRRCLCGSVFVRASFVTWLVFCFFVSWSWVFVVKRALAPKPKPTPILPCILSACFRSKSWLVFFRECLCGNWPRVLWERFESVLLWLCTYFPLWISLFDPCESLCGSAEASLAFAEKSLWMFLLWLVLSCLFLFPFLIDESVMRDRCWVAVQMFLLLDKFIWLCMWSCLRLSSKPFSMWIPRFLFWRSPYLTASNRVLNVDPALFVLTFPLPNHASNRVLMLGLGLGSSTSMRIRRGMSLRKLPLHLVFSFVIWKRW